MKIRKGLGSIIVLFAAVLCAAIALAQFGSPNLFWQMGSGAWQINCPPSTCSTQGSVVNLPGLSAKSQLLANSATSSTTGLINTGISFPIVANEVGTLNCEIYFTNASGGGLSLAVNGPGSPTEVTTAAQIASAATTVNITFNQGTSWAQALGAATSTVTTGQLAEFSAGIENGTTAGTLTVQFADVNTTGPTTVLRDSWCSFP